MDRELKTSDAQNQTAKEIRPVAQMSPEDVERIEQRVSAAVALHQAGQIEAAAREYREVLREQPTNASALGFLGMASFQNGEFETAERLIATAIAFRPAYVDAYNNLGNVFLAQGRIAEAGLCYQNALERNPQFVPAIVNLGVTLRRMGRYEDAQVLYQASLQTCPDAEVIRYNHGMLLLMQGKVEAAIAELEAAHRLVPNDQTGYGLGMGYYAAGRVEQARELFSQWHAADPENPVATHMLSACLDGEVAVPSRASDGYVSSIFDSFANSFEQVLEGLDYRVPTLVAERLQQYLGPAQGRLEVLDAGCGTGLCGQALRAYAERLTGVDLSAGMLAKAKGTELYDNLVKGELMAFLDGEGPEYDVVVAGDALCYFGDVDEVLCLTARRLKRGGYFIATFELCSEAGSMGFKLNPHGRYSHRSDYLTEALKRAGMTAVEVVEADLRREVGMPVRGIVVVGRKP